MNNYCTILVDNNPGQHRFLKTEHGFSLYIVWEDRRLLFDFGSTNILQENANALNIDLSSLNYLINSHSHYDHCNGLKSIVEQLKNNKLYIGKNYFLKKYAKTNDESVIDYLGPNFDERYLIEKQIRINTVKDVIPLSPTIHVISNFTNSSLKKDKNQRFILKTSSSFINDTFEDEVALVLEKENELILIVGCSHPGIVEMVKQVNSTFTKKVSTIIGGTHLSKANDETRIKIANDLSNLGIKTTYLCHCSGTLISTELSNKGIKASSLSVGDTILL